MDKFKLNDRVNIIGKNIAGKIAFIGKTHFSEGEWLGIILDEAKGRNNGSIDGQQYFKCPRNYGLFVRYCQLQKENDENEPHVDSKANKVTYPNYLKNSAPTKEKIKKKMKSSSKVEVSDNPLTIQIHPMNTVIGELKNSLKCKTEEIVYLEKQKKEAIDKTKGMKLEMKKIYDELMKSAKRENDLKLEVIKIKSNFQLLKRKLCKTETSLQSSENYRRKLDVKIEGLREITEHAIIEKEIAEEKAEQFELLLKDEADKHKTIETELDIMKEKMNLQIVNGVPAIHYVRKIESKNEILTYALMKLKDLYENLHNQFLSSKMEVEKYSKEIEHLKSTEKAMESTLCKYQAETSELYDIIDSMSSADDIVFEVTERNLKSEETIKDLYQALRDTENELEVSEETEEALQEMRFMCRDEIDCLESKIRNMQTALNQKAIFIQERESTINKYRELTFTLQERSRKLTKDLEVVNEERKEAVLAAENLKLKIQREKRNTTKDLFEKEMMTFDLENCKDEINYWMPFMPDRFFEEGGENAAIQVKLIASKMLKKLNLLAKVLQSASCDIQNSDELKDLALDTKSLIYIYELQACISLFVKSSDRINPKQFITLAKYYDTLEKENKILDTCFTIFANGDTDKNFCGTLKNVCSSLSQLLSSEYATDDERSTICLTCYLNMIQNSCNFLFIYCKTLENSDSNSAEFKADVNLVKEKVTTVKINVKSILNTIQNNENEINILDQTVAERTKDNWKTMKEVIDCIFKKCVTFTEKDEFTINDSKGNEKLPLNEIIRKCVTIDIDLQEIRERLSSGDYFIECAPNTIFSAVYSWAQFKRQKREEIISMMRDQISTYRSEIDSLRKSFQIAKSEINKIKSIAKKDASQQTYNTGDKTHNIGEYSAGINEKTANETANENSFFMLKDMEDTIKYLRQKNCELIFASVKRHHEILKPLKVLPKPKYRQETHNIFILQKKLNKLTVKLRGILLPQIPDITRKTKSSKVIRYKRYLSEKDLIKREIEEELWNITINIKKLRASSHYASLNINPFIHHQRCDFIDE